MIYAVNKRTKEHYEVPYFSYMQSSDWRYVEADPDGWVKWQGGECPLPNDHPCEAKTRNGEQKKFKAAGHVIGWKKAIIAYRPILDAKPEAPMPEQGTDATTPRRPFLDSGRLRERFGPSEVSAPEWDGEGLPPVGCECEVLHDGEWVGCEVIAHYRPCSGGPMVAVYAYAIEDGRKVAQKIKSQFRPIRSAEDKAVEEMVRMAEGDTPGFPTVDTIMRRLYRAGYRKTATADGEDV